MNINQNASRPVRAGQVRRLKTGERVLIVRAADNYVEVAPVISHPDHSVGRYSSLRGARVFYDFTFYLSYVLVGDFLFNLPSNPHVYVGKDSPSKFNVLREYFTVLAHVDYEDDVRRMIDALN